VNQSVSSAAVVDDTRSESQAGELFAHAALGYALIALSSARSGRREEARSSLASANELLPDVTPANAEIAVQVKLAVARTAMVVGDLAMAVRALGDAQAPLALAPPADMLHDEADFLRAAVAQLCDDAPIGVSLLTPAEVRILNMLPSHLTFREIAEELHVSLNTIKTQAISVYRKLGVRSRSQAVDVARTLGLLDGHPRTAAEVVSASH